MLFNYKIMFKLLLNVAINCDSKLNKSSEILFHSSKRSAGNDLKGFMV